MLPLSIYRVNRTSDSMLADTEDSGNNENSMNMHCGLVFIPQSTTRVLFQQLRRDPDCPDVVPSERPAKVQLTGLPRAPCHSQTYFSN